MKKIMITGATSGIGLELCRQYLDAGCIVGGCGRNLDKIKELSTEFPEKLFIDKIDVSLTAGLAEKLGKLVKRMGGMDICIISAGISIKNRGFDWQIDEQVLAVNVMGFAATAMFCADYFVKQGSGHIAGISSIAKYFGYYNAAYNASKSFEDIYLKGMRLRLKNTNVGITSIIPGFVDTPIISGRDQTFWTADTKKACRQIITAIERKKHTAYITRRWRLAAWLLHLLPDRIIRSLVSGR